jgi:hypothetical protein
MCLVSLCISILHSEINSNNKFYNIGPNDSLLILGFVIDNYLKYLSIISYCLVNSVFRSLFHNILIPWVTNSIQDVTKQKPKNIHMFAYESAFIITIYTWFDWFLYYNILISQIDILMIEIIIDIIMAGLVTNYYLNNNLFIIKKSEYELII